MQEPKISERMLLFDRLTGRGLDELLAPRLQLLPAGRVEPCGQELGLACREAAEHRVERLGVGRGRLESGLENRIDARMDDRPERQHELPANIRMRVVLE